MLIAVQGWKEDLLVGDAMDKSNRDELGWSTAAERSPCVHVWLAVELIASGGKRHQLDSRLRLYVSAQDRTGARQCQEDP